MNGVPASQIDPKLVEPLVDYILDSDDDTLFQIGSDRDKIANSAPA